MTLDGALCAREEFGELGAAFTFPGDGVNAISAGNRDGAGREKHGEKGFLTPAEGKRHRGFPFCS